MTAFFDKAKATAEELKGLLPKYFFGKYEDIGTLQLDVIERAVADYFEATNRTDMPDKVKLTFLSWLIDTQRLNEYRKESLVIDDNLSTVRNAKKVSIKSTSVEYEKSDKEIASIKRDALYDVMDKRLQKQWNNIVCETRKVGW